MNKQNCEITEITVFGENTQTIRVGDLVFDDLTQKASTVLKIQTDFNRNICIILDNDYEYGLRYPWEIS